MKDYVSSAIASVGLLIGTVTLYCAVAIVASSEYGVGDQMALHLDNVVTAAVFVVLWVLTWRKSVQWTPSRRLLTMLSFVWSAAIGAAVGLPVGFVMKYSDDFGIVVGGAAWWSAWIISTMLIWRESGTERATRLAGGAVLCPKCRYNLTGLQEARCPECGETFTLDALFAAQTGANP